MFGKLADMINLSELFYYTHLVFGEQFLASQYLTSMKVYQQIALYYLVLWFSAVFGVGSFVMRAAGCIINDICDKDIDGHVERTKLRPLVSGAVTVKQAIAILFAHLSLGLCVLTQLSWQAIAASFAIMPIVCLYPLTKRFFKYPQIILGLAFNWGIVIGGIQTGTMLTPALMLAYLGGIIHTVIYDTIYAHQDKEFDQQLNLYSTAYTLPDKSPLYLSVPFTASLMAASYMANYHWVSYPGLLLFQFFLWNRIEQCNFSDPKSCGEFFKDFKWYQLFVSLIFGVGSYLKE